MYKLLTSAILAVALFAMPVSADHALGCNGDSSAAVLCHNHNSYGDDCETSLGGYESESVIAYASGVPAAAGAGTFSRCSTWWGDCDTDRAWAGATQGSYRGGDTGYSYVGAHASETGCDGEFQCAVTVYAFDTNTGTSVYETVYDEPCDDTF